MKISRLRQVLVGAALAALLTACGGTGEPTDTPGGTTPPPSASAPSDTTESPAPAPSPTTNPSPEPAPAPAPTPSAPAPAPPPAAPTLPAQFAGRIVTTLPTSDNVVALTFDGGASDTGVPSILQTLAQRGVPATFFVTGDFARRYPDRVRAMAAAGHLVGNHSNTHPDFTTLAAGEQTAQLADADASIGALTGTPTAPWFRFPYGASNPASVQLVNSANYAAIGWTVDTLGWKGTSEGQSAASVLSRVLGTARTGQIVLMHVGAHPEDGSTLDADALPAIIDGLRNQGYRFVTLATAP